MYTVMFQKVSALLGRFAQGTGAGPPQHTGSAAPGAGAGSPPTFGGVDYALLPAPQPGQVEFADANGETAASNFANRFMLLSRIDGDHDGFSPSAISNYFPLGTIYSVGGSHAAADLPGIEQMQAAFFGADDSGKVNVPAGYRHAQVRRYANDARTAPLFERALARLGVPQRDIYLYVDHPCGIYDVLNALPPTSKYRYTTVFNRATLTDPAVNSVAKVEGTNRFYYGDRGGAPGGKDKKVRFAVESPESGDVHIEGFADKGAYLAGLSNFRDTWRMISGTFASKYKVSLTYAGVKALRTPAKPGDDVRGPNPKKMSAVLLLYDLSNNQIRVMDSGTCRKKGGHTAALGTAWDVIVELLRRQLGKRKNNWLGDSTGGTHALGKKCGDWLQVVQAMEPDMPIHTLQAVQGGVLGSKFFYGGKTKVGPNRAIVTHDRYEKTYALLCGAPMVIFGRSGFYDIYVRSRAAAPSPPPQRRSVIEVARGELKEALDERDSVLRDLATPRAPNPSTFVEDLALEIDAVVKAARASIGEMAKYANPFKRDLVQFAEGARGRAMSFDRYYKETIGQLQTVNVLLGFLDFSSISSYVHYNPSEARAAAAAAGGQPLLTLRRHTEEVRASTVQLRAFARLRAGWTPDKLGSCRRVLEIARQPGNVDDNIAIFKFKRASTDSPLQCQTLIDENVGRPYLQGIVAASESMLLIDRGLRQLGATYDPSSHAMPWMPEDFQRSWRASTEAYREARSSLWRLLVRMIWRWGESRNSLPDAFPDPKEWDEFAKPPVGAELPPFDKRTLYAAYVELNLGEARTGLRPVGAGAGGRPRASGGQGGGGDADPQLRQKRSGSALPLPPGARPRTEPKDAAMDMDQDQGTDETRAEADVDMGPEVLLRAHPPAPEAALGPLATAAPPPGPVPPGPGRQGPSAAGPSAAVTAPAAVAPAPVMDLVQAKGIMRQVLYNYQTVFDNYLTFLCLERQQPLPATDQSGIGEVLREVQTRLADVPAAAPPPLEEVGQHYLNWALDQQKHTRNPIELQRLGNLIRMIKTLFNIDQQPDAALDRRPYVVSVNNMGVYTADVEQRMRGAEVEGGAVGGGAVQDIPSEAGVMATLAEIRRLEQGDEADECGETGENEAVTNASLMADAPDRLMAATDYADTDEERGAMRKPTEAQQLRKQLDGRRGGVERAERRLKAAIQQRDIAVGYLRGVAKVQAGEHRVAAAARERDIVEPTREQAEKRIAELKNKLDAARAALKVTEDKLAGIQGEVFSESSPADRGSGADGGGWGEGGGKRHTRRRKASSTRRGRRTRRKRRRRGGLASKARPKRKPRRRTIGRKPVRGKRASRRR